MLRANSFPAEGEIFGTVANINATYMPPETQLYVWVFNHSNPDLATQITAQFLADQEGSITAVRRETANITTRYSFTQGKLKGLAIGTSARYAMGKPRAALSSGGVVVLPATKTSSTILVNPFVSYRTKFYKRNVTAQLNVNNVLGLNSDQGNSYTWPRKTDPRHYVTTVSMDW